MLELIARLSLEPPNGNFQNKGRIMEFHKGEGRNVVGRKGNSLENYLTRFTINLSMVLWNFS
jgi:hypothetical protein